MMVLVLIPVIIYGIVLLPAVQKKLVDYSIKAWSEKYQTAIQIEGVRILPFKRINFYEVLIKDNNQDSLLYLPKVSASIDSLKLFKKQLIFGSLTLNAPVVYVEQNDSAYNFSDLVHRIKQTSNDSKSGWKIGFQGLEIEGGHIKYSNCRKQYRDAPQQFDLRHVNLHVDSIHQSDSVFVARINECSFSASNGLGLETSKGVVHVQSKHLMIQDFQARTAHSAVVIDSARIRTAGFDNFDRYAKTEPVYLNVSSLRVSPSDLARIKPDLKLATDLFLSGELYGTIANLKGRQMNVTFGQNSTVRANFDVDGLPKWRDAFLFVDIKRLKTNVDDLGRLFAFTREEAMQLPSFFDGLGIVSYKGNLTGFLTDLVAFGSFETNLGTVDTDIGLKLDDDNKLYYAGNLSTRQFNIGELFKYEERLGNLTMDFSVRGSRSADKQFFAFLEGTVDSLLFNDYKYQNIQLNGLIANQQFDGAINLTDPNGELDFRGKIDFSGDVPAFNFKAGLKAAKLDKINILPSIPENELSLNLETNIYGNNLEDIVGYIRLDDVIFHSPAKSFVSDSLFLVAMRNENGKHVLLESDLLEGEVLGKYNFKGFKKLLFQQLHHFLPAAKNESEEEISKEKLLLNDFLFTVNFKKIQDLVALVWPGVKISNSGLIMGSYNAANHFVDVECEFDYFKYGSLEVQQPTFYISATENSKMSLISRFRSLSFNELTTLHNLSVHQHANGDSLQVNAFWNNWAEQTNSGALFTTTHFKRRNNELYSTLYVHPSQVLVADSIWTIQPTTAHYHPKGFSIRDFRMWSNNQQVGVSGFQHKDADDHLDIYIDNIKIRDVLQRQDIQGVSLDGTINSDLKIQNIFDTPIITSETLIDDFVINNDTLGEFNISSRYNAESNALDLATSIQNDSTYMLRGNGDFRFDNQWLDLSFQAEQLKLGFLNVYLNKILQNLEGTASGHLQVAGPVQSPVLSGRVNIDEARFKVGLLNTTYTLTDSVVFYPNQIHFMDMEFRDVHNHVGLFTGTIDHTLFRGMSYDLLVRGEGMHVLNTRERDNERYFGSVYADGNMAVTGTTTDLIIDIAATSVGESQFYVPLEDAESVEETNFIRFAKSADEEQTKLVEEEEYRVDVSGMDITMDLEITPAVKVQVIFDSKIGDILKGSGNGDLQIRIDKQGAISFYGEYTIEEGDYMFTLQNVINKRFQINPGSMVNWDGSPYNALVDIMATYPLKASLYDLVAGSYDVSESSEFNRRVPINCNLLLSDRLLKPAIRFEILTPSLQNSNQYIIDEFITSEEELNRQVLSLLVLNRFYTPEALKPGTTSKTGSNAAVVTTTEVLSNQLSHWLSQMSKDVDIGVSYRPGDEITSEEIEVALSTQMFNNRVTLNGNVGYGRYQQTEASKIIGDFDLDVKLNKKGTIRAKAYTHSNNDIVYETGPTTQGVGISFREEFTTFGDLMRRYWNRLTGKNKKEAKEEKTGDKEE